MITNLEQQLLEL
jgi:hypothetical protein